LKYHKNSKYLFIFVAFVILTFVPIAFHVNYSGGIVEFDNLYRGLKEVDRREDSFLKFISSGENSCEFLLEKLAVENNALIKCDIIEIIGYIKCSNCQDELVPFLNDPNWRVRFFTVDVLGKLKHEKLFTLLPKIILKDPNERVKIGAIIALGKCGNEKDVRFLEKLAAEKEYQGNKLIKAINMALTRLRSKLPITTKTSDC